MAQPAGHIRIITEKLREQGHSIFRQVATAVQDIAVGFPLLHFAQPPCSDPHERIEPQYAKHRFHHNTLDRMAMAYVTGLMVQNDHPTMAVEPVAEIDSSQKGKRSPDGSMLGQYIASAIGQTCPSAQTRDIHQSHDEPSEQHAHRTDIHHTHRIGQQTRPIQCTERSDNRAAITGSTNSAVPTNSDSTGATKGATATGAAG